MKQAERSRSRGVALASKPTLVMIVVTAAAAGIFMRGKLSQLGVPSAMKADFYTDLSHIIGNSSNDRTFIGISSVVGRWF